MADLARNVIFESDQITGGFSSVLRSRVEEYFQSKHLSKHCNFLMLVKTGFYLAGFVGTYLFMIFGYVHDLVFLLQMMLMGFFMTGIGFNIAHDGAHGAYSSHSRVNQLAAHAFELIGGCSYTWKIRHNLIHHTYTNIVGADGDLESMFLLRFCLKPNRMWVHRFQHLYAPFLYGLVTLVWVLTKDYKHLWQERSHPRLRQKPPLQVYLSLFLAKAMHYTLFLLLPFYYLDLSIGIVALGFLSMHFVAGTLMAFTFQLGHCVNGPVQISLPENHRVPRNWVEHQMMSACNFGQGHLLSWICGGLNYQIEHHLFPRICHVHYPALSGIVKKTAHEFGIPYYHFESVWAGLVSHFRLLKYWGRTDLTRAANA